MTIFERVATIIADELCIDAKDIEMESNLSELGADSLHKLALAIDLEDEFDIDIPDREATKLYTVRDAVRYIENAMRPTAA